MRRLAEVGILVTSSGCLNLGSPSASGPPPDITGVWAVTMRYEDGSCPDVKGGTQASMWTVNQDAGGSYAVTVQGDQKFPTLTGGPDGAYVTLLGLSSSSPTVSTQWRVQGTQGELQGRALETHIAKDAVKVKTNWGESERDVVCSVVWNVEASKQGK